MAGGYDGVLPGVAGTISFLSFLNCSLVRWLFRAARQHAELVAGGSTRKEYAVVVRG